MMRKNYTEILQQAKEKDLYFLVDEENDSFLVEVDDLKEEISVFDFILDDDAPDDADAYTFDWEESDDDYSTFSCSIDDDDSDQIYVTIEYGGGVDFDSVDVQHQELITLNGKRAIRFYTEMNLSTAWDDEE